VYSNQPRNETVFGEYQECERWYRDSGLKDGKKNQKEAEVKGERKSLVIIWI
jgi:hypothetical protein